MDRGFDNLPLVVADLRQPPRDIRALVAQSMLNDFLETGKMFRRALMLLAPYILSIGKWSVLSIVSITGIAYENIANTTSPTIWQYPSFVNGTSASTLPTFFLTLLMMGLKYQIAGEPRIRVHSLDRTTKFVCCVALVAVFFGAQTCTINKLENSTVFEKIVMGQTRASIHLDWLASGLEIISGYLGCAMAVVIYDFITFVECSVHVGSIGIALSSVFISCWYLIQTLELKIRTPEPIRPEADIV
ncbi:hypothetical protein GCK72_017112 [Caenorhabditis remanei]|uniref:Uncharacterized protein n=1 Tax=Caenorhabditis remanei TaxID=31234 RepID=A0A6A5G755_CAERE|nr:hypothetical protein GCK72_017112 [Caenorhabditis remanei]KAF1750561.1 hypothetical protein GCK72_017112 [Caenorhabditis remanei]